VTGDPKRYRVVICRGPECGEQRGSAALHDCFLRRARELGLESRIELGWQACFGRCRQGPNVLVRIAPATPPRTLLATLPSGPGQNAALYNGVRPDNLHDDVGKILQSHVARGIIVRELVLRPDAFYPPVVAPAAGTSPPNQNPTITTPSTASTASTGSNDKEPGGEPK
jgi:(2Fe-2S) ferredoxin